MKFKGIEWEECTIGEWAKGNVRMAITIEDRFTYYIPIQKKCSKCKQEIGE